MACPGCQMQVPQSRTKRLLRGKPRSTLGRSSCHAGCSCAVFAGKIRWNVQVCMNVYERKKCEMKTGSRHCGNPLTESSGISIEGNICWVEIADGFGAAKLCNRYCSRLVSSKRLLDNASCESFDSKKAIKRMKQYLAASFYKPI